MQKRSVSGIPVKRKSLNPTGESLRIVLPYVVLGFMWIFFSDWLLHLASDIESMVLISTIKGLAYVAITAVLLWALVYSRVWQIKASQSELEGKRGALPPVGGGRARRGICAD